MNKLAGNMFWVLIGVVLLAELVVWGVVVRGKASANAARIEELVGDDGNGGIVQKMKALKITAWPPGAIDTAAERKRDIEKDYAKMVLFLIGMDDFLDHFGSNVKIHPSKVLRITDSDKTRLGRFLGDRRAAFRTEIAALGMVPPDSTAAPLNLVDYSGSPVPTTWIYAYKQLWIQDALLKIMTEPLDGRGTEEEAPEAEAAGEDAGEAENAPEGADEIAKTAGEEKKPAPPAPLVPVLKQIEFRLPDKDDMAIREPRFVPYHFTLEVSMPDAKVPVLIERILKNELPFIIESFVVTEKLEGEGGMVAVGGRPVRVVDVKVECKVNDFSMGVVKVVFSKDRKEFQSPKNVKAWLAQRAIDDKIAEIIKNQTEKTGVHPSTTDQGIEYNLYDQEVWLTEYDSEQNKVASKCEIYDGVTVYYGSILKNVPEKD